MEKKERPSFLSALCILTFIGSGLAFFIYLFASLFFKKASDFIIQYSSWNSTDDINPFYFILLLSGYIISFFGALKMWRLNKTGLFFYIFSQLAILFLPVIWLGWSALSMTNTIFTIIFISGYSVHYKYLK